MYKKNIAVLVIIFVLFSTILITKFVLNNCNEILFNKQSKLSDLLLNDTNSLTGLSVEFEIEKYSFDGACWLSYPIIYGMDDFQLQNKLNNEFKEKIFRIYLADKEFQEYLNSNTDSKLNYTLSCDVKLCNNNIISIVYSIVHYWEGSAMDIQDSYTVNINLRTGEVVNLSDLYKIDEIFSEKLMNCETDLNGLINSNNDNNLEFVRLKFLLSPSDYVYFTDNKLGISVAYLMTSYYAIYNFEISYEDLVDWEI